LSYSSCCLKIRALYFKAPTCSPRPSDSTFVPPSCVTGVCVCAVCLFLCFVLLVCVYVLVFVCTRVFVLSWVFFAFMDFYLVAIVPFLLAWLAGLFTLGASKPRVHERYMWMSNHARPC